MKAGVTRDIPTRRPLPRINTYPFISPELFSEQYGGTTKETVRASECLNSDTKEAAQASELIRLLTTGEYADEITQKAWPDDAVAQEKPDLAQHQTLEELVTVKEKSFVGAFIEEFVLRYNYIRQCLNNRTNGQMLKIRRPGQSGEDHEADVALGKAFIRECEDGLKDLVELYDDEIAVISVRTDLAWPGSSTPIPKRFADKLKRPLIARLRARRAEITTGWVAGYNNNDLYHDATELDPELMLFQWLTRQQKYEALKENAELVFYQISRPAHGYLDLPRCFEDPDLRHYITFLTATHLINSYKNVVGERMTVTEMLGCEIPQVRLRYDEIRRNGDSVSVNANVDSYKGILEQYWSRYPEKKVEVGGLWVFPEAKEGKKRKSSI